MTARTLPSATQLPDTAGVVLAGPGLDATPPIVRRTELSFFVALSLFLSSCDVIQAAAPVCVLIVLEVLIAVVQIIT